MQLDTKVSCTTWLHLVIIIWDSEFIAQLSVAELIHEWEFQRVKCNFFFNFHGVSRAHENRYMFHLPDPPIPRRWLRYLRAEKIALVPFSFSCFLRFSPIAFWYFATRAIQIQRYEADDLFFRGFVVWCVNGVSFRLFYFLLNHKVPLSAAAMYLPHASDALTSRPPPTTHTYASASLPRRGINKYVLLKEM